MYFLQASGHYAKSGVNITFPSHFQVDKLLCAEYIG